MFRAVSAPNAPAPEASEKKPRGSILYVKLKGTIDQSFDGQAIGVKAKGKILILDLADVKRVSSSGLRGWMALVSSHEPTYLVECSPHVVSQINVMAGLAGLAKVVSFYATYRCAPCSREFDVLFLTFMIKHHQGAIQMVQDLYAAGGGQEVEIDTFAKHVEADQNIEISRMQQMLAERTG